MVEMRVAQHDGVNGFGRNRERGAVAPLGGRVSLEQPAVEHHGASRMPEQVAGTGDLAGRAHAFDGDSHAVNRVPLRVPRPKIAA